MSCWLFRRIERFACRWANNNRPFLQARQSPLEFLLHQFQYLQLLLGSEPPNIEKALMYARANFAPFAANHTPEIRRLMACVLYLPLSRMKTSPYADLASPSLHLDLDPMFAREYCASLGMSRQIPLKVVIDIGGGGALARIEKGRKLMRERKSEWSQTDELPVRSRPYARNYLADLGFLQIEIPLPPENRYHSIFACPVSKEQSTEQNPPMMMSCGHVVTKDSLQKLSKLGG
jgi:CTLH/CRA C-terminal to LisH motif domain